jgi:hypothetical protein
MVFATAVANGLWRHDATSDNPKTGILTMTKAEFGELFRQALDVAAKNAEAKRHEPIPRSFEVRLHSFGHDDDRIGVDEAIDKLYLGSDLYYRIIDVAIEEVLPEKSVVFVRVSGHPPNALSATWDPSGLGPFKPIVFDKIDGRAEDD